MPEEEFYGWMKIADDFDLLWLNPDFVNQIRDKFASHPFVTEQHVKKMGEGKAPEKIEEAIEQEMPSLFFSRQAGRFFAP